MVHAASPPTILGDAVPRHALLWLTSQPLTLCWQFCAPLCGCQGLSSSPVYIHGCNCKGSGTQLPTSPAELWSAVCGGWMPVRFFICCIFCIPSHVFGLLHRLVITKTEVKGFLSHLDNLCPTINFTMEQEMDGKLPFLDTQSSKAYPLIHNHR